MESFTQIDSISIDLLGVAGKSHTKCEHFSIRKYVSGMRQKESKLCWPFKLEKDTSEVPKDMLPPLDVPKFRWWRCQACIPELCIESTPAEKVIDNSGLKCKCESASTNLLSQSQTATVASDFRQIMNVGIASTGKSDATILPQINGNDIRVSLYGNEKKDKEHQTSTLISKEDGVSQGKGKNADRDCGGHEVVGRGNSFEISQLVKQPSNLNPVKVANGSEYGGVGLIDGVNGVTTVEEKKHSFEEVNDCPSSDSGDLSEDYFHAKNVGLRRRKNRKVRLLTDLLGKDTHPDQAREVNAPCPANCDESAKTAVASATDRPMAVPENVKKFFKKRKRSLPFDPDSKKMNSMTPSQESGKEIVCKDGPGNSSAIVESQIEDDELARMDSRSVRKNHWAKHKEDAVVCAPARKKKKNYVTEDYFRYKSGQIRTKPTDVMFSFGHETSAGAVREMNSFLFPASKNERSLLCKDKTEISRENCGQVAAAPPSSNPNPSGGVFMRTDSGVMQASPPPFWFIPTSDASVENRSHVFSRNSLLPPKVDKAYSSQFGLASSFHWLEGAREDSLMLRNREARHTEPKRPSRCVSAAFPDERVLDVFSKGSTYKIPRVQTEKQSHASNLENAFCCMKPQMQDISGTSTREKATKSQEFSATMKHYHDEKSVKASEQSTVDDIPMEIVELMAKNQYERSLDGAGKNKLPPRTGKLMDSGSSRIAKECRNRELNLLQKESIQKRPIHSGNPRGVVIGKDFRSPMQKFVQSSSCPITNYASLGHVEGTPNTARHVMFSQDQEKSVKVRVCVTDPPRQGTTLNGTMNEDVSRKKPSDTSFERLQAHDRTHIPRQSDEPIHMPSTMIPTHMPFVYNVPSNGALHPSHMDAQSYRPKMPPKVEMNWSRDPRLFSFSAANFEKPSKDFHFNAFSRACVENVYAPRHKGLEVENGYDSFDFRTNETIPAMHLLSLMHGGPSSGQNIDSSGNDRSKYPSFLRGYHSKEIQGKALSEHKPSDPSKCSSSGYCPTNFLPGRYHKHSAVPIVSESASSVQPDKFFVGDTESQMRLPLKVRDKGKRKCSDLAGLTGCSTFSGPLARNAYSGMSDGGNFYHKSGNFFGMPNPRNFLPNENSEKAKMDAHNRSETIWPLRCISEPGVCTINRNPADFSMPEEGNIYTIGRNDLKFEKEVRFPKKYGLTNLDGLKEKSSMKLTSGFRIPQHQLG